MAIKEDGSCGGCNNCCSEIIDDSGSCCGYDTKITPCSKNTLISLGVILILFCVINICLNWRVISFSIYYIGVFILIDSIPNAIGIVAGSFCFLCDKTGYAIATLVLVSILSLFGILAVEELGIIVHECNGITGDLFCNVVAAHFTFSFLRLIVSLTILVFLCFLLCMKKKGAMSNQDSTTSVNNP